MADDARYFRFFFAAAGVRDCGNGRRVALAKRRSNRGEVVGHLLVPLCRRSAGELVSVTDRVKAKICGGQGCCAVSVAYLGSWSWSAGQVRIVHGKSAAESVPRSRDIPMCDVPACRGGRRACASVEAKGGERLCSF